AHPGPVLVRLAFRAALPLPQRVSTIAESLMLRSAPEVVRDALWSPRLLPEEIGALANELVQTRLGFRQHTKRISVWGQLTAAADMHLGVQTLEFLVRDQLSVPCRLQRLLLESLLIVSGTTDGDRKRVQQILALPLDVDQALRHETLLAAIATTKPDWRRSTARLRRLRRKK